MSLQDQMMENRNYWNDSRVQNSMFSSIWEIVEQGEHQVVISIDEEWIFILVQDEAIETLVSKWVDDEEGFTLEYRAADKEAARVKAICDEYRANCGHDWTMYWKVPKDVSDESKRLYANFEVARKLASVERGKIYDKADAQIDVTKLLAEKGITPHDKHEHNCCMTLQSKYEVCGLCTGSGKMTDPNIDCGGISREDFDDDPDFEGAYFSGRYDMTCSRCNGKRVEAHPQFPEWLAKEIASHDEDVWDDIRESCAERAMGA